MTDQTPPTEAEMIEMRLSHLEQAYITLLERVMLLERGLRSESGAWQVQEAMLAGLAGLPARVDRLEEAARAKRFSSAGGGG